MTFKANTASTASGDMRNPRGTITLGENTTTLAEQLRILLDLRALIDVVRLALGHLRLAAVADQAGWAIVIRMQDKSEYTVTLRDPNYLVPVQVQAPVKKTGTIDDLLQVKPRSWSVVEAFEKVREQIHTMTKIGVTTSDKPRAPTRRKTTPIG